MAAPAKKSQDLQSLRKRVANMRIPLSRGGSPGASIPQVGLGTWKATDGGQVAEAVRFAIVECGVRHIDTAAIYGNEAAVGQGISAGMREAQVPRSDMWVTTKLWNDKHEDAEAAMRDSLSKLGLDYVDEWLMHFPVSTNKQKSAIDDIKETWAAMEKVQHAGLAKCIGVSNFSVKKLRELQAHAKVPIAVVQAESHPMHKNDELIRYCAENGIHFTSYSILGSGDSVGMEGVHESGGPELMKDTTLLEIARRLNKSPAQVCVRWALQRHPGTSLLFKSANRAHILENCEAATMQNWTLSAEDMKRLSNLPQRRMCSGAFAIRPEGPYRTLAELWDTDE